MQLKVMPMVIVEYMQIGYVPKKIIFHGVEHIPTAREEIWNWARVQEEWPFVQSLDDLLDDERLYANA